MTGYGNISQRLRSTRCLTSNHVRNLERSQNITTAVNVPVIADADTGYGNAVNVMCVVKIYEKTGIATFQLEDQLHQKNAVICSDARLFLKTQWSIKFDARKSEENIKQITSDFKVPVLTNMIETGRTPLKSKSEQQAISFDLAIFPCTSTFVVAKTLTDLMNHLKKNGTTEDYSNNMLTFEEFTDIAGLPEIREAEEKYKTGRKAEY